MVARGESSKGMSEIGEGDEEVQTSSYKTNESWGTNVQHGEYRQRYCNNFVWGQMVTRPRDDHFAMYRNF